MFWRYTCTACGIVIRLDHQASGKDVVSCLCGAEVTEEPEPDA